MKDQILDYMENSSLEYLSQGELSKIISIALEQDNARVFSAISELLKDGDLVYTGKNKIATAKQLNLRKGVLAGKQQGFCFCRLLDAQEPDVFIPHSKLKTALNKDKVLIKISTKDNRREGEVFKIIQRHQGNLVGTLVLLNKQSGFVTPDDSSNFSDIYVDNAHKMQAKNMDKVVVRIEKFEKDGKKPEGKIIEVLGDAHQRGVDILSILREFNLYEEFEKECLDEAKHLPDRVTPEAKAGRTDFTGEVIVTIDGDDSKDFDDAISIEENADSTFTLGVHIADVGHYVKQGSALDREAYRRGTSVYLPGLTLPMLPVQLSNNICSLNPGEERLTLSVIMKIDTRGNVLENQICEGVIKSAARMTYTNVFAVLQNDPEKCEKYANLVSKFKTMYKLHQILLKKREKRGALDLDIPESKVTVDDNGATINVEKAERNTAHKLIESFMLEANETIALEALKAKLPFVYRVHEQPDSEKMSAFFAFISSLGEHIKGQPEDVEPKQLQLLLNSIKDKPYSEVVSQVMLRSLQKARYASKNLGHFGLAAENYCHFTSPIRRYPDLTIHRIIKNCIIRQPDQSRLGFYESFVVDASLLSSEREKLSEMAERAVDDLKKAEFMLDKVGQQFEGVISGVTNFGIFVELDNTVEGLCNEDNLPEDKYLLLEKQYMLKGSKHKFQLGGRVKVEVISVNLQKRQVNFKILP